jgi:hypothetical protein
VAPKTPTLPPPPTPSPPPTPAPSTPTPTPNQGTMFDTGSNFGELYLCKASSSLPGIFIYLWNILHTS